LEQHLPLKPNWKHSEKQKADHNLKLKFDSKESPSITYLITRIIQPNFTTTHSLRPGIDLFLIMDTRVYHGFLMYPLICLEHPNSCLQ